MLEVPVGTAAKALSMFVASHPQTDFEVHGIDLQRVDAVLEPHTLTIDKPSMRSGHVRQLTFSSMTKLINAKRSMIPMGTFELLIPPRTIASEANRAKNPRCHASSQYTRLLSKVYSANGTYHCSVQILAKDKTVPAEELIAAHLMAMGEFFSHNRCPLTVLDCDFSCCAAMCNKRSLNVGTLIRWHFEP